MQQRTTRKRAISIIVIFSLVFCLIPGLKASAGNMSIGEKGLNIIKSFEKCRLTAYKATAAEKYYTIGWGHYGADVSANMTITQEQADNMLISDVRRFEGNVNTFLSKYGISVNQNQFDALTSFTYNVGNVWLNQAFSLKTYLINGIGNYSSDQIRTSFTNWNKQNGKVLDGLTRRRNMEADLFLSADSVILPGVVDTGYSTPIRVVADHKCSTYDDRGQVESNRWIDAGDVCTIHEVYTNGFVKITYPVSGGTRDSYAKASDFSISKEEVAAPNIRAWFTDSVVPGESMGASIGSDQFKFAGWYYLCYELTNPNTGRPFTADADYTVKETVYRPDGSQVHSYSYSRSSGNWIGFRVDASGTFKGVVEISGDYIGSVTVTIAAPDANHIGLNGWFSESKMGTAAKELEKGKFYYFCYELKQAGTNRRLNDLMVLKYSIKEEIRDPDGNIVRSYSYANSDNNWIGFTASKTGTYTGYAYMTGDYQMNISRTAECKEKTVPATALSLSDTSLNMTEGDERTLTATVFPNNATDKNVTWTSSNSKVATVNNGRVKAVSEGIAKITVKTADGAISSVCNVKVSKKTISVTGVSLNDISITLTEGEKRILTATVSPSNATDKSVKWTSSDTSVATVKDGVVTALKKGTATITVTTTDGAKKARCKVTVSAKTISVTDVSLSRTSLTLLEGEKQTLTATVSPWNAMDKSVKWTSSDTSVATVKDGVVTALKKGTAAITVTTADGNRTAKCTVNVIAKENEEKAKFVVAKVSAQADSEVTVDISIQDNPGITALKIMLEYPEDELTLKDVEYPELFSSRGTGGDKFKSPFVMSWFSAKSKNETANGVFARVVFKVKKDVEVGEYVVRLKYDTADVVSANGEEISFRVEDGSVVVEDPFMPGDVNGDRTVNMKDIVILQKKLNGWDVTVHESSADMNHDGVLNMKDIVLLQKYLNGWS